MSKANKYSQSYQWEDKSRDLILRQLALPVGISTRPFIHLVMLYRILSTSASMFSCLSEEARRNSASSAVSRFFTASTIWRHLSRIFSSARCDEVAFACNEIVQITQSQLKNDSGPRVLVRGREDSDKMTAFGKNISWSLSVYELTFHNSCQSRICLHAWHTETLWLSAICKTSTSAHKSFYQPLKPKFHLARHVMSRHARQSIGLVSQRVHRQFCHFLHKLPILCRWYLHSEPRRKRFSATTEEYLFYHSARTKGKHYTGGGVSPTF